jgi:hypothetical protein
VEKEAECSMALQPPEREGVNQDDAQVWELRRPQELLMRWRSCSVCEEAC